MTSYRQRLVDGLLAELLAELPALMLVGPRAVGKTTTALRHAKSVVRLDRPAEAAAFKADPDAALRVFEEPVLLDEWQVVPEVLGAVKRAVDSSGRPGRFLLTGSVRADLEEATWPATGRVVRVAMYPLTVAEVLETRTRPFVDRAAAGEHLAAAADTPDLGGYVELALTGGFPEPALKLGEPARIRWLEGYVDQLLTRDALLVDGRRDPALLRRYVEAYALNSAGVVGHKTIYDAAGVNRKTADAYERLLENLMVVDRVPAWSSNRLKRLTRRPKRYLVDPSLVGAILGLDLRTVLTDGDLLGRLLDTFVASQLRAQVAVASTRPRLYHLRDEQGRHEIDVIAELGGGGVVAVETKSSSAPDRADARHLLWLRERLGSRFVRGVILHTGPATYEIGDEIVAAPISTLWA